jgi:hypothetical protein
MKQLGTIKAWWISASKDALWIIEDETRRPFKFDQQTQQFIMKGTQQAMMVVAGLNG